MARARAAVDRRRGDPRRARPLVPRSGHDRGARARSRPLDLFRRPVAQLAPRESRAAVRRHDPGAADRRRHRQARALRRALPLQEEPRQARAGQADAHRPPAEGALRAARRDRPADAPREEPRLRLPEAEAKRPDRDRGRGRRARGGRQTAPCGRVLCGRARRARGARRPQRLGEDDVPRDLARAARAERREAEARPRRRGRVLLAARDRARREPVRCSGSSRTRPGCSVRRRRTCSAASSSRAGRCTSGPSPRSREGSGAGSRSPSWSPRARTCSCSTSRRTTSTWRAARRSRRLSTRSRARSCSFPTTVPCWTRSPTARSRSRTGRSARTTAAGPSTSLRGTNELRRRRPSRKLASRRRRSRSRRRARKRPTELERLEADIAGREAEIADLERRLAEDWSNVDVVAAHRRAREELQTLLARWEELFETA